MSFAEKETMPQWESNRNCGNDKFIALEHAGCRLQTAYQK